MKQALREVRRAMWRASRYTRDVASGDRRRFAWSNRRTAAMRGGYDARLAIDQCAGGTEHAEAKRHNILTAAKSINSVVVMPGAIFSFWRLVGRPSQRRGFVPGRSLVRGRIELDYGGGLCQLSGMLYYVALKAGLGIMERHEHTRDIYTDSTRYAPLGADAAVAYGVKDLRIANTLAVPIGFAVELVADTLRCAICAPEPLREHAVRFERHPASNGIREVDTYRAHPDSADWVLLARSRYAIDARDT